MASDPLIGQTLGNYEIGERIGAGGMGVVYRATDLVLGRPVAFKVLAAHLLEDATARTRFQREIRSAVAVEHPNIVPVYAGGFEADHFFLAMRLVNGPNLSTLIAGDGLTDERALRLFEQIASALGHVHRSGLVHRDVKPQNVLVANVGEADEYAMLTDFGIARALNTSTMLTRGIIGTPEYLAPEILQWKQPEPASDQYSLACVLYEMLSGKPPFTQNLPLAHIEDDPPRLTELCEGVSEELWEPVEQALAKFPRDRFPDMRAFADRVKAAHQSEAIALEPTLDEVGIVKWWDAEKGYGFISSRTGGVDLFAHFKHIAGNDGFTRAELIPGSEVTFEQEHTDRGPRATKISGPGVTLRNKYEVPR